MLTWVVVAESARARIFTASGPRTGLEEIATLTHPAGRLHERDLVSDGRGRSFDSAGHGRHAMGTDDRQKQLEGEEFARQIAAHLEQGRQRQAYGKLIIVAPPQFLGLLRKSLPAACTDLVVATVNKNLVQQDPRGIRDHLPHYF